MRVVLEEGDELRNHPHPEGEGITHRGKKLRKQPRPGSPLGPLGVRGLFSRKESPCYKPKTLGGRGKLPQGV